MLEHGNDKVHRMAGGSDVIAVPKGWHHARIAVQLYRYDEVQI